MLKQTILFFGFFLMVFSATFSQKKLDSISKKTNPILFAELDLGYAYFSKNAFSVGLNVNYQIKNHFLKFRFSQSINFKDTKFLAYIPIKGKQNIYDEFSLMYGRRYIKNNFSYHFTGGFSLNNYTYKVDNQVISLDVFYGFPLEIGVNWFPSTKETYRIFGLIPVGKPTSFTRSTGVKIKANIAKKSYVGIAFTIGLGWHKQY